ncbi:MAG: carboxymuconolactone decarboxylase family protein [Gammaproteobacteria bacterium]
MCHKENLAKWKKTDGLAPGVMKAFWTFDKVSVAEGAIPVKYKELIAIAVALTTQCPYCIDMHASRIDVNWPRGQGEWGRTSFNLTPGQPLIARLAIADDANGAGESLLHKDVFQMREGFTSPGPQQT